MTSENYIVINGKKAELTEEQLRQLGIEVEKKNPFARCKRNMSYYCIDATGDLSMEIDVMSSFDNDYYDVANYCTDHDLMQQRAWRETLSRLLWRYSMKHDGDKIDWNTNNAKYYICQEGGTNKFVVHAVVYDNDECTHFYTREIAENAIEEIIKPFMKEHPDFVW